ncbi:MAG: electron transport complex subunit E [Lachnospiraceae bacterium]|nr:electron transport complex subunit E [Lachnospiraceae bacterium]
MNKYVERLYNGLWKENPTTILMLGMCPTLAVTTSATNGIGMGLSTLAVLILSNLIISACRNIIPDEVRLPAYIVIAASLVTVTDLIMQAYTPSLYDALGIYIPLIVVNCIILGRAEAYAGKNEPALAAADGLGMGLGFTIALVIIGSFREILGNGTIFGTAIPQMPGILVVVVIAAIVMLIAALRKKIPMVCMALFIPVIIVLILIGNGIIDAIPPVAVLVRAPGAFLVIGCLVAILNALQIKTAANAKVEGCDSCGMCSDGSGCDLGKEAE